MMLALVISGLLIAYVYVGYALVLWGLSFVPRRSKETPPTVPHRISVFVSAYNEADVIGDRLENLAATDYPLDRLEIIVISDGSTDATADRVEAFAARHPALAVRLYDLASNRGRAYAQNLVAREASGDILVATDAETEFEPGTLGALARAFDDPAVGVAGGRIVFRPRPSDPSGVGTAYLLYWRLESAIRRLESDLGLGVKTGGPCTAYRRKLWEPIADFEDVDQVVSLMARAQGYATVYVEEAVAFELANAGYRQEVKQRARMTRKALLSISNRWGPNEILAHPRFSFALVSHKVLRLFSPFYFGTFAIAVAGLLLERPLLLIVVAAATAGAILLSRATGGKGLAMVRSLIVSQLGMALGIVGWATGNDSGSYVPTRSLGR